MSLFMFHLPIVLRLYNYASTQFPFQKGHALYDIHKVRKIIAKNSSEQLS